jgi:hypothetical protein
VQRSGDRVRITAQLIQASADRHLWANAYERDLRDVFALEREVTHDIADHVQARIASNRQGVGRRAGVEDSGTPRECRLAKPSSTKPRFFRELPVTHPTEFIRDRSRR